MRFLVALLMLASSARATVVYFDAVPSNYLEFNPIPLNTDTHAGHTVKQLTSSCSIRFNATTAAVVITSRITYLSTRVYALLQDGIPISYTTLFIAPPGDQWQDFTLASGLSGAHEYEIICSKPFQGQWGNWFDQSITVDTLNPVAHPNRPWLSFYGDSRTGYTNSRLTNNSSPFIEDQDNATLLTDIWIGAHAVGKNIVVAGVGGGSINPTGRDSTGNIPAAVDEVHSRYGYNDEAAMPSGAAALTTATSDMIDNIRAQIGAGKPIYQYAPLKDVGGDATKRAQAIAAIKAGIAGKANVYWVDTDDWVTTTTAYMPDNVHQNVAGAAQWGNRNIPLWSSTAFNIKAPAQGTSGTPSANFTVTLSNTATFTGDQDITLTSSAGIITATAAGGTVSGNGTGNVTITPANGAINFTATYNATGGGTSLITPSTAQSRWTMPTPAAFNANVVAPGNPAAVGVP